MLDCQWDVKKWWERRIKRKWWLRWPNKMLKQKRKIDIYQSVLSFLSSHLLFDKLNAQEANKAKHF